MDEYQMKSLSSWSACNFPQEHLTLIYDTMPPLQGWSKLLTGHTYTVYFTFELENIVTMLWTVEGATSIYGGGGGGLWFSIVNSKICNSIAVSELSSKETFNGWHWVISVLPCNNSIMFSNIDFTCISVKCRGSRSGLGICCTLSDCGVCQALWMC